MARNYIGVIDQGTTGTQFAIVNRAGEIIELAFAEHDIIRPTPERTEYRPQELWHNTRWVIGQALENADISGSQLASLGVANQRQTTILWDADTGEPLANALAWGDQRTSDRMESLRGSRFATEIRERTGLIPDAYFAASKLEWLLRDVADEHPQPRIRFGTVDSWLIYNLTGSHVTDVSNASQTMLYNIHENEWDDYLLEKFGIPREILPEVRPSSDRTAYGWTDAESVFEAEIPVCAALGDQQAALVGQTCFEEGEAKTTYGTGSFFVRHTGDRPVQSDHLLTTVGYQFSGEPTQYVLEGPMFTAGAALNWLERVGVLDHQTDLEALLQNFSSKETYLVPAIDRFGSPHWQSETSGSLIGLTFDTRREHIIRAVLESIAFHVRHIVDLSNEDTGTTLDCMCVDSGLANNDAFCQLQANALDIELVRPNAVMTTVLGAAYAAGLAVDFWDSTAALRSRHEVDQRFTPDGDRAEVQRGYERWREIITRQLDLETTLSEQHR